MADATPRPGRLIAVDGTRGADVLREAQALAARLQARGIACTISRWDASGLFGDLLLAGPEALHVSPRMLTLLYAADLVFRLRCEIQPALREGRVVIAAPYLRTATAIAVGMALPDTWVRELLRFAPEPDATRPARERKRRRGWRRRPGRGFGECAATLLRAPEGFDRRAARRLAMEWMAGAAAAGPRLTRKALVARLEASPVAARQASGDT